MKIRTDFVTNSSSSSFVVEVMVDFADGTKLALDGRTDSGDFESEEVGMEINEDESYSFSPIDYCMEALEMYDPEDVPWEVNEYCDVNVDGINLMGLDDLDNVVELKKALSKPFGLNHCFEEDFLDEDEEFEDESAEELIESLHGQFNEMVQKCDEFLTGHLRDSKSIEAIKVTMEFGGRGEMLASPEEIAEKLFGYNDGAKICAIAMEDDFEEACEKISEFDCMKNASTDAIETLVEFIQECDISPEECIITQTMTNGGKVELDIQYEE